MDILSHGGANFSCTLRWGRRSMLLIWNPPMNLSEVILSSEGSILGSGCLGFWGGKYDGGMFSDIFFNRPKSVKSLAFWQVVVAISFAMALFTTLNAYNIERHTVASWLQDLQVVIRVLDAWGILDSFHWQFPFKCGVLGVLGVWVLFCIGFVLFFFKVFFFD